MIEVLRDNFQCDVCNSKEYSVISFNPLIIICEECGRVLDNKDFIIKEAK